MATERTGLHGYAVVGVWANRGGGEEISADRLNNAEFSLWSWATNVF